MNEMTNNHFAVAGDWHGDLGWALRAIRRAHINEVDTLVHLGDFGIWPGPDGQKFIRRISDLLVELDMNLYVVPGNHEDYAQIGNAPIENGVQAFADRITLLTRGYRWAWGGVNFVALGGANSIDFEGRTQGINWWQEESITLGDAYRTVQDGVADVMFAHEAPSGVVPMRGHGGEWSAKGLAYANQSSEIMLQVVDVVQPKLFMHGHYHYYYDKLVVSSVGYTTRYVGTDKEYTTHNLALVTLDTLEVEFIKV